MIEFKALPIIGSLRNVISSGLAFPTNLASIFKDRKPIDFAAMLERARAINTVDKFLFRIHRRVIAVINLAVGFAIRSKDAEHLCRHPFVELPARNCRGILRLKIAALSAFFPAVMNSSANAQRLGRDSNFKPDDIVVEILARATQSACH